MEEYYIVTWPESQHFIGHSECYLIQSLDCNKEKLDSAYCVPVRVYNQIIY